MRSGALKNGSSAYGYRFLKSGFSFSEQQDLAFALGFPALTFVADGHPDDADPLGNLHKWRVYEHAILPATIALYLVRDHAWGHRIVMGDDDAQWLATKDEPLSMSELKHLVPRCLKKMYSVLALYRWEALTSTDEVLSIVMAEFERQVAQAETDKLNNTNNVMVVKWAIPTMMMRVTEPTRDAYRKTLAQLHGQSRDAPQMCRALDVALDRGEGCKTERWRIHGSVSLEEYIKWLETREIDESSYPDAREAFLGGEHAIELMRKRWREYKAVAKERIVSQYGGVRSEQTVLLFLDLLGAAPKLKRSVKEWFVERADYARPILLDLEKKSGPTALLAKKALKDLDGAVEGSAATPESTAPKKTPAKKPAKE